MSAEKPHVVTYEQAMAAAEYSQVEDNKFKKLLESPAVPLGTFSFSFPLSGGMQTNKAED
jgi:hypothetical protein